MFDPDRWISIFISTGSSYSSICLQNIEIVIRHLIVLCKIIQGFELFHSKALMMVPVSIRPTTVSGHDP